MARLEDGLPALREGKKIRAVGWRPECFVIARNSWLFDELGRPFAFESLQALTADWEIVPEPVRVADYLVPIPHSDQIYCRQTHPIGQQPEGSVMVPGSERSQD